MFGWMVFLKKKNTLYILSTFTCRSVEKQTQNLHANLLASYVWANYVPKVYFPMTAHRLLIIYHSNLPMKPIFKLLKYKLS